VLSFNASNGQFTLVSPTWKAVESSVLDDPHTGALFNNGGAYVNNITGTSGTTAYWWENGSYAGSGSDD